MRYAPHWTEYPPDDPPTEHPEGYAWCSEHGCWECDCAWDDHEDET